MKKLLLFLILTFIFLISPVYAEWMMLSTADEGEVSIYVDLNTIRRNGNTVLIWTLQDFKQERMGESSMKVRMKFDCKEETSQVIHLVGYSKNMGSGKVTMSTSGPGRVGTIEHIIPDSSGEAMWKLACNRK
jgi:hypothetical protein